MNIRNLILGVIVVVALGYAFYYVYYSGTSSGPLPSTGIPLTETHNVIKESPRVTTEGVRDELVDNHAGHGQPGPDQLVIASLQEQFHKVIHHPRIQLQVIEKVILIMKKRYPETWQDHVRDYLAEAFPEYIRELMGHYKKLQAYTQWAEENRKVLSGLPIDELRERIWGIRQEIFGDEAFVIWDMVLKKDEIKNVLGNIEQQKDKTFQEKAVYFSEHLKDIYSDNSQAVIKAHQQELINKFLNVPSVQNDLESMNDEERNARLTDLRESMGFDDGAIKRWATLDEERINRWTQGKAYMGERENILISAAYEDREERLDNLRWFYFGKYMAETIKQEEISGMFRFSRKRFYGKN